MSEVRVDCIYMSSMSYYYEITREANKIVHLYRGHSARSSDDLDLT